MRMNSIMFEVGSAIPSLRALIIPSKTQNTAHIFNALVQMTRQKTAIFKSYVESGRNFPLLIIWHITLMRMNLFIQMNISQHV